MARGLCATVGRAALMLAACAVTCCSLGWWAIGGDAVGAGYWGGGLGPQSRPRRCMPGATADAGRLGCASFRAAGLALLAVFAALLVVLPWSVAVASAADGTASALLVVDAFFTAPVRWCLAAAMWCCLLQSAVVEPAGCLPTRFGGLWCHPGRARAVVHLCCVFGRCDGAWLGRGGFGAAGHSGYFFRRFCWWQGALPWWAPLQPAELGAGVLAG